MISIIDIASIASIASYVDLAVRIIIDTANSLIQSKSLFLVLTVSYSDIVSSLIVVLAGPTGSPVYAIGSQINITT